MIKQMKLNQTLDLQKPKNKQIITIKWNLTKCKQIRIMMDELKQSVCLIF